ncbi:MAG: AAA family ATPase [Paludibacteraceae bacterium]|nr:AAA family ATPase [Paludibacteraceae bacterium]
MLFKHCILKHFKFEPTKDQTTFIDLFSSFMNKRESHKTFLLKGYAGTGKTTLVSALVKTCKELNVPIILLAPTGRAAKVLGNYSSAPASTIHRAIYHKKSMDIASNFVLGFNKLSNALFVVDEASMINTSSESFFGTGDLLSDLIEYVFSGAPNTKLLLLGDDAQLPPVFQEYSPALDVKKLESMGLDVTSCTLTEVLRQSEESGILVNATHIRQNIDTPECLQLECFPDVKRVDGSNFVECLEQSFATVGMEETLIVTRSNKMASLYANGIRNRILSKEGKLSSGDKLMVLKNNYFFGGDYGLELIANGDMAEIVRMGRTKELYGFNFRDLTLFFPDYSYEIDVTILEESLICVTPAELQELNTKLFKAVEEDYAHIKSKRERYKKMREDKYLNALQVKLAYAITCHKAQGGQWKHIYVDMGRIAKDEIDISFMRWLYTAVTRATEKLYLIQFSDDYFK